MFCTKCGKSVANGSLFCEYCGSPIKQVGQPAQQQIQYNRAMQQSNRFSIMHLQRAERDRLFRFFRLVPRLFSFHL